MRFNYSDPSAPHRGFTIAVPILIWNFIQLSRTLLPRLADVLSADAFLTSLQK